MYDGSFSGEDFAEYPMEPEDADPYLEPNSLGAQSEKFDHIDSPLDPLVVARPSGMARLNEFGAHRTELIPRAERSGIDLRVISSEEDFLWGPNI